jgi:hypothetical protein
MELIGRAARSCTPGAGHDSQPIGKDEHGLRSRKAPQAGLSRSDPCQAWPEGGHTRPLEKQRASPLQKQRAGRPAGPLESDYPVPQKLLLFLMLLLASEFSLLLLFWVGRAKH